MEKLFIAKVRDCVGIGDSIDEAYDDLFLENDIMAKFSEVEFYEANKINVSMIYTKNE